MNFLQIDLSKIPNVMLLGEEKLEKTVLHKERVATEYIIYIITKGQLSLEVESENVVLSEGDVRIFFKGEFHKPKGSSCCEYIYIHLGDNGIKKICAEKNQFDEMINSRRADLLKSDIFSADCYNYMTIWVPQQFSIANKKTIEEIKNTLKQHFIFKTVQMSERLKVSYVISDLFIEFENIFFNGNCKSKEKTLFLTNMVTEYILLNYKNNISGKNVAEHFGYSFDYINRIYKRNNGISIMKYCNKVRIDNAKTLINTTNLPLKIISDEVGFCNVFYFNRVFKQFEGITPGVFLSKNKAFYDKKGD